MQGKVKARRVRVRRSNRTAAVGRRPSRLVAVMVMAVVGMAATAAMAVATVRARRNLLRRKPVATARRRANLKAHGRLALRCSAASRAVKAAAVQVDAIRPARDNVVVK